MEIFSHIKLFSVVDDSEDLVDSVRPLYCGLLHVPLVTGDSSELREILGFSLLLSAHRQVLRMYVSDVSCVCPVYRGRASNLPTYLTLSRTSVSCRAGTGWCPTRPARPQLPTRGWFRLVTVLVLVCCAVVAMARPGRDQTPPPGAHNIQASACSLSGLVC